MAWRLAQSLVVLRDQVNAAAPLRSKISDGTIGDIRHQRSASDHNGWFKDAKGVPIVSAIDFTHDPKGGFDAYVFAEMIKATDDQRVKYVISNGRIWARTKSKDWRTYHGSNKHDRHTHVSVRSEKQYYDSTVPWAMALSKVDVPALKLPRATLRRGTKGGDVFELQRLLNVRQPGSVEVDGDFGLITEAAVVAFQEGVGLPTDGVVGTLTWTALGVKTP